MLGSLAAQECEHFCSHVAVKGLWKRVSFDEGILNFDTSVLTIN